jgi:hypothetical protein
MPNKKNLIYSLSLTFLLSILVQGCGEESQPQIPYVYVNIPLYPNSLDFIPIGGYLYVNGGYKGIVVYRFLENEFGVYERCCPYDPEKANARITVDPAGNTCVDSACMSKYILYDGSPYAGPSPYLLMKYRYSYDGDLLLIYN